MNRGQAAASATALVNIDALLAALGEQQRAGAHLRLDSRAVQPGDVFVALVGSNFDGRDFIDAALAAGASAVVVDAEAAPAPSPAPVGAPSPTRGRGAKGATPLPPLGGKVDDTLTPNPSSPPARERGAMLSLLPLAGEGARRAGEGCPPIISVQNLRAQLGELGHRWYGAPSEHLTVLAVTGTNGKTSCVQWLAQALNDAGVPCGVVGTLGLSFAGQEEVARLTTPDVLTLHRVLAQWRAVGARAVALEASSIGVEQGRLDGVRITVAAYTNLSRDHLDYHGEMAAYAAAKARLFGWPGLRAAVVNLDDAAAAQILTTIPHVPRRLGFSLHADSAAALRALDLRDGDAAQGLSFTLATPQGQAEVATQLIGAHNAANLLLVAGVLQTLGWPLAAIAAALGRAAPVRGRLEAVRADDIASEPGPQVVVDYAHTPDALQRALAALRPLASARGGRLVCVFGCGGGRDAGKRPLMGKLAATHADAVVVTSDNPRGEAAWEIIDAIVAGARVVDTLTPNPHPGQSQSDWRSVGSEAMPRNPSRLRPSGRKRGDIQIIPDRDHAILRAVWSAAPADVVLVAGKGHETYQETAGVRLPFDDREWARAALALWPAPSISTDTRSLRPGDVFVALAGERHDGHDHLTQAQLAGARAAIVARRVADVDADFAQIVLGGGHRDDHGNTMTSLATLAAAWRAQHPIPVIAVTGSNGKTTTKEMIAAILAAWLGKDARLASPGNYNNLIGVPLALLPLRGQHRAAVVELGMNHPGEIAALAAIAQPTVALVNNAQREHLEFMATVDKVARENGSVLTALQSDGVAVYPADDDYTALWDEMSAARQPSPAPVGAPSPASGRGELLPHGLPSPLPLVGEGARRAGEGASIEAQPPPPRLRFGLAQGEVHASDIEASATASRCRVHTPQGAGELTLPLPGLHNLRNALAAIACTQAVGAPLATALAALAQFRAVAGRMQRLELPDGSTLIDDTYNANPDSVRAAIDVLAQLPAPRALVLGDMGEVGADGPALHFEVGAYARERGIEILFTLGEAAEHARAGFAAPSPALRAPTPAALAELLATLNPASVLVKGSRVMCMERVVAAYQKQFTGAAHAA